MGEAQFSPFTDYRGTIFTFHWLQRVFFLLCKGRVTRVRFACSLNSVTSIINWSLGCLQSILLLFKFPAWSQLHIEAQQSLSQCFQVLCKFTELDFRAKSYTQERCLWALVNLCRWWSDCEDSYRLYAHPSHNFQMVMRLCVCFLAEIFTNAATPGCLHSILLRWKSFLLQVNCILKHNNRWANASEFCVSLITYLNFRAKSYTQERCFWALVNLCRWWSNCEDCCRCYAYPSHNFPMVMRLCVWFTIAARSLWWGRNALQHHCRCLRALKYAK